MIKDVKAPYRLELDIIPNDDFDITGPVELFGYARSPLYITEHPK